MKCLTKISLYFFFFLFSYTAFAQVENYQPAEILDYQNDTIKGFINYLDWRSNPTQIMFRETLEGESKTYFPKDLKYFTVAGNKYFSQNIIIESSLVRKMSQVDNMNDVAYGEAVSREPVWDTISTFLELVLDGEKSLYLYRDGKYRSHWFIKNNGLYELLYYFIEFADAEKQLEMSLSQTIVEHRTYQDQLSRYFKKCPNIQPLISNLAYEREAITSIFNIYYDCQDQKATFEKRVENDKVVISALAGLVVTDFNVIGAPTYQGTSRHWVHGTYPMSKQLTGGVGFELVLPGNFGRNIFLNEIMYKGLSLEGSWSQNGTMDIDENRIRAFQFKMDFAKINMLYRQKRQISPNTTFFANAGITHNLGFERVNEMVETSSFFGSISSNEYVALRSLNTYHIGFIGGFGFGFKRFSGELRYEFGNDLSELTIITSSMHNYNFILGYRLN